MFLLGFSGVEEDEGEDDSFASSLLYSSFLRFTILCRMSVSIAISKRRTPKARHKLQIERIGFTAFWTFSGAGTCCGYQSADLSRARERERTTNRSLSDSVAVKSGFPLVFLFQVSVLAKEQLLEVLVSPPRASETQFFSAAKETVPAS